MRKSNIDGHLLTHGLRAMCAANFLLYAAVYMLLGVLPVALADDAACIYPAFLAGMLLAGPFHAYPSGRPVQAETRPAAVVCRGRCYDGRGFVHL